MATNVIKQDSVLIWDDQGTDLNNPRSLQGGATRDTTNGYHVLTGTRWAPHARDQAPERVDDGFRSIRLDLVGPSRFTRTRRRSRRTTGRRGTAQFVPSGHGHAQVPRDAGASGDVRDRVRD